MKLKEKFLETYNSYLNDVYRLALSYMKNVTDAEDVTQIVFIKLYEELKKRILDSTINREDDPIFKVKKQRLPKLAYATLTIFVVALLGIGVVFAKEYVEQYILKRQAVNHDDEYVMTLLNPVEINAMADLSCKDEIALEEVEENLGITLLGHNENFEVVFNNYCSINKDNNEKITDLYLYAENVYDYTEENKILAPTDDLKYKAKEISFSVQFYTNNAAEDVISKYTDKVVAAADNTTLTEKTNHINNLNADVIFVDLSVSKEVPIISTVFVNNNMLYSFHFNNLSEDEIIKFLENLE